MARQTIVVCFSQDASAYFFQCCVAFFQDEFTPAFVHFLVSEDQVDTEYHQEHEGSDSANADVEHGAQGCGFYGCHRMPLLQYTFRFLGSVLVQVDP